MNLKNILFARFQPNKLQSTTTSSLPIVLNESIQSTQALVNPFLIVTIILIIIGSFMLGFLCWGCLVLCRRRRQIEAQNKITKLETLENNNTKQSDVSSIMFIDPDQGSQLETLQSKNIKQSDASPIIFTDQKPNSQQEKPSKKSSKQPKTSQPIRQSARLAAFRF